MVWHCDLNLWYLPFIQFQKVTSWLWSWSKGQLAQEEQRMNSRTAGSTEKGAASLSTRQLDVLVVVFQHDLITWNIGMWKRCAERGTLSHNHKNMNLFRKQEVTLPFQLMTTYLWQPHFLLFTSCTVPVWQTFGLQHKWLRTRRYSLKRKQ